MLFNSIEFAFFFLIVTFLYFALPHKSRWFMLLIASCYFYMAFVPVYILILAFTIIVDYFAGIWIERSEGPRRKTFLVISLVANIGILVVFKYWNFFNTNVGLLLNHFSYRNPIPFLSILLPLGLSFHTFQAMSYTIEVYRGNQPAEKHFGIYSLYVMFYPQLVAGPIERPQNLLHQFHEKHRFNYDDITSGLKLMAWGLFKKMVIADRLGAVVNTVYQNPQQHNALSLLIGTFFFSIQIYCDFSGYSDIALGTARTMGFKLMTNFNTPFFSKSITEFWRRWHISLSTWFNDYLFTPLIINWRNWGKWATALALLVTFFISGVWHGAGWTFIIFGTLHGIAMVYEFLTKKTRKKLSKKIPAVIYDNLSITCTFIFATFTWIFFRAPDVGTALQVLKGISTGIPQLSSAAIHGQLSLGGLPVDGTTLALCTFLIVLLFAAEKIQMRFDIVKRLELSPFYIRWAAYLFFVAVIASMGVFTKGQFIYFQF